MHERERDRAGAGADVEHLGALDTLEQREGALDEHLGLGSRHERAAVTAEGQPAEAPLAEDVGERLAAPSPLDERAAAVELRLGQRPVVLEVEVEPCEPERVREDELGVEPRRADSALRRGTRSRA